MYLIYRIIIHVFWKGLKCRWERGLTTSLPLKKNHLGLCGGGGGGKGEMVHNYMYTCINLHVQSFGSLK